MIDQPIVHTLCYVNNWFGNPGKYQIYYGEPPEYFLPMQVICTAKTERILRRFAGYLKKHYPKQKPPENVQFLWEVFTAKQERDEPKTEV